MRKIITSMQSANIKWMQLQKEVKSNPKARWHPRNGRLIAKILITTI